MGKRDRERKERVVRGAEQGYRERAEGDWQPASEKMDPLTATQFFLNVLKIK